MPWKFFNSSGEVLIIDGGLHNILEDTTPQLGGNLDMVANLLVGNGGSTGIAIASTGEVTMAAQPAFLMELSSADANVTGDGTAYLPGSTGNVYTEVFDKSNEVTTAGVFTPTVAGMYLLGCTITVGIGSSLSSAHDNFAIQIVATGKTLSRYQNLWNLRADSSSLGVCTIFLEGLFEMAASNTAKVRLYVYDGAKTIDIETGNTTFWGCKVA
jgi:hypothetical protein